MLDYNKNDDDNIGLYNLSSYNKYWSKVLLEIKTSG